MWQVVKTFLHEDCDRALTKFRVLSQGPFAEENHGLLVAKLETCGFALRL